MIGMLMKAYGMKNKLNKKKKKLKNNKQKLRGEIIDTVFGMKKRERKARGKAEWDRIGI